MKRKRKKKIQIWVIEDDETQWEYQKETIEDEIPNCKVKFFLNAGYAAQSTGSPDFILIDIGGLSALGCDVISLTRANIEGLFNLHPGAIFVINSALFVYARDVWEELKPECQAISKWADGCCMREDICKIIKEYL